MRIKRKQAVIAGLIATAVMTVVGIFAAPMMGLPAMNPADMLALQMGGVLIIGWMAHLMIGTTLAVVYAAVAPMIPGPPAARGALYGVAPFLLAQIIVMPMMGMPLFSGSAALALGSLVGHLAYGGVLGAIYGLPAASAEPVPARAAGVHAAR
jgi:uncharacterized membrane protein YagU involved in acid resistance